MVNIPTVLLSHRFPPENRGTPANLETAIKSRLDDINLTRGTDYRDTVAKLQDANVYIEHYTDMGTFRENGQLDWVQSLSSGYDRYDLEYFRNQNIMLTTVSGVHANPIAEYVIGSLLMLERGLDQALRQQDRNEWQRWTPRELAGKTMGIIGVGAIGGRIAELATAHGLTTIGTKRDPTTGGDAVDELYSPDELHTVLGRSDYVVVACPLTEETAGMFEAQTFASMSCDSVFINIARGSIVDQSELVDALQEGQIRGAVLDVFDTEPLGQESPLWDLSNVVLTPHLAGGSPHYTTRVADIFVENYTQYITGNPENMQNRVV